VKGPAEYKPLIEAINSLADVETKLATARKEIDELERLTHSLGIEGSAEKVDWTKVNKAEQTERLLLRKIQLLEEDLKPARAEILVQEDAALRDLQARVAPVFQAAVNQVAAEVGDLASAIDAVIVLSRDVKKLAISLSSPLPKWVSTSNYFIPRLNLGRPLGDIRDSIRGLSNIGTPPGPREQRQRVPRPGGGYQLETFEEAQARVDEERAKAEQVQAAKRAEAGARLEENMGKHARVEEAKKAQEPA
jgi:hypothetical protein